MTKEELIRMADSCESPEWGEWYSDEDALERFAALFAAHTLANIDPLKFISYQEAYEAGQLAEREACAKVCDEHAKRNYNWASENADIYHAQAHWAGRIAAAIRARGQE